MNYLPLLAIVLTSFLGSHTAWATKIHECEDEQGNRTFQKYCPPGSTVLAAKNYSSATHSSDANAVLPALVLYAVPDCAVCDQLREDLSARNISVTEKNIKDNGLLQQELKSKTGGDLRVPVLLIGEQVISGYEKDSLSSALEKAGYESAGNSAQ